MIRNGLQTLMLCVLALSLMFSPTPINIAIWAIFCILAIYFLMWQPYKATLSNQAALERYFPAELTLQSSNLKSLGSLVSSQWFNLDRMSSMLNAIREGVLGIDRDGLLILSNTSADKILNWKEPQLGQPYHSMSLPNDITKAISAALNGESHENVWKSGKKPNRRYYELTALPWEDKGGCVLILRDITKIRQLERVRRDFVANISHELRTPITIVRANAETLINGAVNDPEYGPRFLSAILRNGERLSTIIDELLDISRLEAGQYTLHPVTANLHPLLERIIDTLKEKAISKDQEIFLEINPELKACFDETALEHIISNYIDNAIKYTPNGGKVWIRSQEKENRVHLLVEDNGPGIPPKHRVRVFERFYRVDKGRSRTAGGTGLGLSVVRHFAEAMGAKVGVRSEINKGSTFWCSLPIQPILKSNDDVYDALE